MALSCVPEFQLAAACAMWPPSCRRTEAIRARATGPLDWPRFMRVVRRHRVVGLVHDELSRAQANAPPEIAGRSAPRRRLWCATTWQWPPKRCGYSAGSTTLIRRHPHAPEQSSTGEEPVHDAVSWHIDKTALPSSEPRLHRDREHLNLVRLQPCVICGRQPWMPTT
jgi:hypothetical protein